MTFLMVSRQPEQRIHCHVHTLEPKTFMGKRFADQQGPTVRVHQMVWNYHAGRGQWEAFCEAEEKIFYAQAVEADIPFRKGRTWLS